MRREAFEKAIECENGKPPSETIDLSKYGLFFLLIQFYFELTLKKSY